jgi:hypothetical protein
MACAIELLGGAYGFVSCRQAFLRWRLHSRKLFRQAARMEQVNDAGAR